MEAVLKSIGWDPLFPETIKRLDEFKWMFSKYFPVEEISNEEIENCVALSFGLHGQGMVFNIYSQAQRLMEGGKTLTYIFDDFVNVFKDNIDKKILESMKPKVFIELFIDYLYSLHIKE